MDEESLLGYYVEVTHNKNGVAFCRVSMGPMNQVYAGWLVAIAGTARSNIWSNNREKLGDIVETALGLLKLIDEKREIVGTRWRPKLNEQQGRAVSANIPRIRLPALLHLQQGQTSQGQTSTASRRIPAGNCR